MASTNASASASLISTIWGWHMFGSVRWCKPVQGGAEASQVRGTLSGYVLPHGTVGLVVVLDGFADVGVVMVAGLLDESFQ
jgi:hypothetical protein